MPTQPLRRAVAFTATAAAVCALALSSVTAASAAIVPDPIDHPATTPAPRISLEPVGTFETGAFAEGAAEIVQAYGDRLFVVNALAGEVQVLDFSDPAAISEEFTIGSEGTANSVAIRYDGLGVVAFEDDDKTAPGHLVFFNANAADAASAVLGEVTVGALPDMVTFSKDGLYAVAANEGEPADDFSADPEGSVSVVTLPTGVVAPAQSAVKTADFHAFEQGGSKPLPEGVRVFGPTPEEGFPVSRNLEPEYVAIDGAVAYVTLQEANSVATVDLKTATVSGIRPLGYKDYGAEGNGIDASDEDGIEIAPRPGVKGVYMPDGINAYQAGGKTYLVTANEGDAREWGEEDTPSYFIDEARVKDLGDDGFPPICEGNPLAALTDDADLGRLKVISDLGVADGADCYSELYSYGGRSFSIWNTDGTQVFDSGDDFEQITAAAIPENFNSDHEESNLDDRSDDKGPEPENLTIGAVGGRTYAFVGLERVGGVMVYDITDPGNATFVTYVNNRDFDSSGEAELATAGDLGPEGLAFIPALQSPTGQPMLAVGNEVSGTTTVYSIADLLAPDLRVLTINDFHGRLVPETGGVAGAAVLAGAVKKFKEANPNTLFASAGDNIGASAFESWILNDDPTIDALKAATLDVSAVGNHEFDKGFADLRDRVLRDGYGDGDASAGAAYGLGANVYLKGTETPALEPYTIETTPDGTRIAFIGAVTDDTRTLVNPDGIADIEFGDVVEALNREADAIEEAGSADVIIALVHDGSAGSDCAAIQNEETKFGDVVREASAEIDAIVSAHTHQRYACELTGPTGQTRPVIQAHQYGTTLGSLDIRLTDAGDLESITPSLVSLVDGVAPIAQPDPETAQIVEDARATAAVEGAKPVGEISDDITRAKLPNGDEDRGSESTLGNLVADVYLWATTDNPDYGGEPTQIAFMNPGGLRADLLHEPDGVVTYREAANVQPFGNTLVTLSLTGEQIKAVLEEQWQPDGSTRPKLHLGVSEGFSYEYDPAAPRGERVYAISLNGEAIDPSASYRVVTNSFLAAGGDNFFTFASGTGKADSGQIDLEATVDFFAAAEGPIDPAPLGRAVVGTGPSPTPTPTVDTDWAKVDVGSGRVEQGGTLNVTVSGLEPGQQIGATLFSDPIVVTGIPAANASGITTFSIRIPADFALGAHTLVVTSAGYPAIEVGVTVVSAGSLAATGTEMPWGLALGAAAVLVAAGMVLVLRRRRTTVS